MNFSSMIVDGLWHVNELASVIDEVPKCIFSSINWECVLNILIGLKIGCVSRP